MRQCAFKHFKVKLLKQQHHVVEQHISVTRRNIDSLFKRHLRVFLVSRVLKGQAQIAKSLLIIWLNCQSV